MSQWTFVAIAYAIVIIAVAVLAIVSAVAMRRSEVAAETLRERR